MNRSSKSVALLAVFAAGCAGTWNDDFESEDRSHGPAPSTGGSAGEDAQLSPAAKSDEDNGETADCPEGQECPDCNCPACPAGQPCPACNCPAQQGTGAEPVNVQVAVENPAGGTDTVTVVYVPVYIPTAYPQPVPGERCGGAPECGGCATCEALCECYGGDPSLCAASCDALRGNAATGICSPGQWSICTTTDGRVGARVCLTDGQSYSSCTPLVLEGQTGTGGASGTGGSASTGGSVSTGGSGSNLCEPGNTRTCNCSATSSGYQVCGPDRVYGDCQCPSGTGGTSGTGGSSSTGGSTSTGGSAGTGGGASTTPPDVVRYVITFHLDRDRDEPWPDYRFTHYTRDDWSLYFPGQECSGDGFVRTCVIDVDKRLKWEFYVNTGKLPGPGSDLPGLDGVVGECRAYSYVAVSLEDGTPVPFQFVENYQGTGCNFAIEPYGAEPAGPDADNDGVAYPEDCNDTNPSVRPRDDLELQIPIEREVCGTGISEDCSTPDRVCGQQDSGTGGTGGTSGTGGTGGSSTELTQVTFNVVGETGSGLLTIVDPYETFGCSSAQVFDYAADAPVSGATCVGDLDTSCETQFHVRVNGVYATGYTEPAPAGCTGSCANDYCAEFLRVYAFRGTDSVPYAQYGSSATASFPRTMYHVYVENDEDTDADDTCHLRLPAW
jgi:hypothetical protein